MVWDAVAFAVTAKAIGTVESNLKYGAVNPTDPITIGAYQWYGVRAAEFLFSEKIDNLPHFDTYCPSSIKDDMLLHPASDKWWNSRHVTKDEISDFYDFLTNPSTKSNQDALMQADVAEYLPVADKWGLDKDSETKVVAFFCTIYHQSPKSASRICASLPAKSTLNDIYKAALNDSVVGKYRSRQTTAYNIINEWDPAGISNDTAPDGEDGYDGSESGSNGENAGTNGSKVKSDDSYIMEKGNNLVLVRKNGDKVFFYPNGGMWVPHDDGNSGASYDDVDPDTNETKPSQDPVTNVEPGGPSGGGGGSTATAIVNWARSKLGVYKYSQAAGRMNPAKSGYTDCSAFIIYGYQVAGNVKINATYTGNLCTKGRLIHDTSGTTFSESIMQKGDLIFLRWGSGRRANSPFDHVELYCGDGKMISMGRTPGPVERAWNSDINYALGRGGRVMIRRIL